MAIRTEVHRLRYDPESSAAIFRLACQQNLAYNLAVDVLNRKPTIAKLKSDVIGKDGKRKSPDGLFGNIKKWRTDNRVTAPTRVLQQGADDAYKANDLMRRARQDRLRRLAADEPRKSDLREHRRTLRHRKRKTCSHTLSLPVPPRRLETLDKFAIPGARAVVFQTHRPVPADTVIKSFRLVEIHRERLASRARPEERRYALHLSVAYPDAVSDDAMQGVVDSMGHPDEIVGVDVGVKKHWATSEGDTYHCNERVPYRRFRKQQQELAKKRRNSRRRAKLAKKRRAQSRRRQAERDRVFNAHAIDLLSRRPKAIALEQLDFKAMTASGAGTTENPGRRVAQKRGLNRSMRDAGLSRKCGLLAAQAVKLGVPILYVDARGSSQSCSRCGHRQRSNRESQTVFQCRQCGFRLNADLNAAVVIRNRAFSRYVNPDVTVEVAPTGWRTQASQWGQQPLFSDKARSSPRAALRPGPSADGRQGTGQTGVASRRKRGDATGAQIRMEDFGMEV